VEGEREGIRGAGVGSCELRECVCLCMSVCGCWCVGDYDGGGCCFFPPVAAVCILCVCVLSGTIYMYILIYIHIEIWKSVVK